MSERTGWDNYHEHRKQIEEQQERNRELRKHIPELFLAEDGDIAVIRILSSKPFFADFHNLKDEDSGRFYTEYCTKKLKGECEYCEDGDLARENILLWVLVKYKLHRNNNEDETWEKVEGRREFYKEEINLPMLIKKGSGKGGSYASIFEDAQEEHDGVITDRDYKYKRHGAHGSQDTFYTLSAMEKSDLPKECKGLVAKLPKRSEVARGEVKELDYKALGFEVKKKDSTKAKSSKKKSTSDDDD